MSQEPANCNEYNKTNKFATTIALPKQSSDMGKEDRQLVVLAFLAEHGLALPQRAIFRNLKLHHGITFGYGSVDNYLDSFVEEGWARRVDPTELENRELVDLPGGKHNRAYYIITDEGREHIRDS